MSARILSTLLQTKSAQVPVRVLLRNTAAVVAPLALGEYTGHLLAGIAVSIGAIVTMNSDQPGPYRERLMRLLAMSVAGGISAFAGLVLAGHLVPLLLASVLIGFAGALLVALGDAAARVGMVSMMLLVIATDLPAGSVAAALRLAAAVAGGGLLLTLFSIASWPFRRYGPERTALATVYRGLAAMARQSGGDGAAPAVTEGMNTLQHTLLGPHRARGPLMDTFGVLLELAERIRLELIALTSECPDDPVRGLVQDESAAVLDATADAIVGSGDSKEKMLSRLESLQIAERKLSEREQTLAAAAWRHSQALSGQLAAAVRNAARADPQGARRSAQNELLLPRALRAQSALATLGASLTPRSAAFRHAIRSALCFSLALAISRVFKLPHGYWIPMTVAIVLRADFAATLDFGLLRVAGTVLGLVLTTALLHWLPAGLWVRLAVLALLCTGFRYFAGVQYGIAVASLTGMVVLLLALAGEAPEPTMISRLINTVAGSVMALAAYGLWPTWERSRNRATLARMLRTYGAYIASLAAGEQERREIRHAARLARGNAEASIKRLLAEPATPAQLAELAQSLLTNSNRLVHTAMALEASAAQVREPFKSVLERFVRDCAQGLERVADALQAQRRADDMPPIRTTQRHLARLLGADTDQAAAAELLDLSDRLVDNINTLAHIVSRAAPIEALPASA